MRLRLWTPIWKSGFERQIEKAALNAKLKKGGSERQMKNVIALNVEMKTRLWTPNGKSGSERQMKNVIAMDV